MAEDKPTEENGCTCDCESCKKCCEGRRRERGGAKHRHAPDAFSQVHVNDTVGAVFLGILSVMLLIFLVRSNKRNRELLLEVIELHRQA